MAYCNNKAQEKARHSRVRHPNDDTHKKDLIEH